MKPLVKALYFILYLFFPEDHVYDLIAWKVKISKTEKSKFSSVLLFNCNIHLYQTVLNCTISLSKFSVKLGNIFMPPTCKGAGGTMFSGYPSGNLVTAKSQDPWVDFHQIWHRDAPWGVDKLIGLWARSAQSQRSKVNELGLNMLFLPRYREISRTPWWIFIKLGTGVHHEE